MPSQRSKPAKFQFSILIAICLMGVAVHAEEAPPAETSASLNVESKTRDPIVEPYLDAASKWGFQVAFAGVGSTTMSNYSLMTPSWKVASLRLGFSQGRFTSSADTLYFTTLEAGLQLGFYTVSNGMRPHIFIGYKEYRPSSGLSVGNFGGFDALFGASWDYAVTTKHGLHKLGFVAEAGSSISTPSIPAASPQAWIGDGFLMRVGLRNYW